MRIAMVTPYPEEEEKIRGGVESVAATLIGGLREKPGLELHVVSPSRHKSGQEKRDNVFVHWVGYSRIPGFIGYWTNVRAEIQRNLRKIEPDLTHFQGAAGWCLGYRKPYVLTIHGINEKNVLYSGGRMRTLRYYVIALIERIARRKAKNVILISPYVEEEIGTHLTGRRWAIENPVANDFFQVKRENILPRILFAGRISRQKNIDGLIRAFKRVHDRLPTAELRLAGLPESEAYEKECYDLCKNLGIVGKVRFLGNLNRSKLIDEFSMASCLALVSHQETAPVIVEEAMAAGLPVVASKLCGLPFMVEDGETGFLVNPNDEEQIADCLYKLLHDATENVLFGQRGNAIAKRKIPYNTGN